jgi:hypothetical protein
MRTRIDLAGLALLWLFPVAVAGLAGSAAAEDPAWASFTSKDGRFSVEVPSQPVQTETQQKSFVGTVTNHIFTATSGHDTFTVDYSDIPHFALHFAGPDTIYEHAKGALLQQTYGKQTAYSDVPVSGVQGKRLVYDTPAAPDHPEMRGDAILVLVGTRLYVIDGVVPEAEADAKSAQFLSSIAITE